MGRNNADFNAGSELVTFTNVVGKVHHGTGKKVTANKNLGLRTGNELTFDDGSTGMEYGSRVRVRKEASNEE